LLDNFCMGNPKNPEELGKLVECAKGMADVAEAYLAPFISGKDSFYNCFETEAGEENIPVTLLVSGLGLIDDAAHITGNGLRRQGSCIGLLGSTRDETGGSAYARAAGLAELEVARTELETCWARYRAFVEVRDSGLLRSAHALGRGGLGLGLVRMAVASELGLELTLDPLGRELTPGQALGSESTGRIVLTARPQDAATLREELGSHGLVELGVVCEAPGLRVESLPGLGLDALREGLSAP